MPDYSKGKIYTIRCRDDPSLIYVGSTAQTLSQRWAEHKRSVREDKYNSSQLYNKMKELGCDKFYIELYEDFKCERREQLAKKEGETIRQISTINKRVEGRTNKEYYEENKEYFKDKGNKYYEENKEKVKIIRKERYERNKEKELERQKQYNNDNKEKRQTYYKNYYENNFEKISENAKQYTLENKEKIHLKAKTKIMCECGCLITRCNLSTHKKTQSHNNLVNNKTSIKLH
jgi:hypothetical protein